MNVSKIISALLFTLLFLFIPQAIFCQTEMLDGVTFTPPKGWIKTPKEGAAVYTIVDKTTNAFCLLTIYGSSPSVSSPDQDFTNEWNNLVVKPFKAESNPKTESQTNPEGWQATAGGSEIELSEGVKAVALLTVFSGFGKTVSILSIFNDQSYLTQMQTFIDGIKLDKTKAVTSQTPIIQNLSQTIQNDLFPDQPNRAPQKPLLGTLKSSITMADLAGTWDNGAASVVTYVDSSNGNYSGTDTSFFSDHHLIKPDGSFEYKFVGRASNHTVRETDSGTVILSGDNIIFKFKGRSTYRYQLIAYMTLPNGAAVLTLIHLGDNGKGLDAEQMRILCGHGDGIIHCSGGEEWARLKPAN